MHCGNAASYRGRKPLRFDLGGFFFAHSAYCACIAIRRNGHVVQRPRFSVLAIPSFLLAFMRHASHLVSQ